MGVGTFWEVAHQYLGSWRGSLSGERCDQRSQQERGASLERGPSLGWGWQWDERGESGISEIFPESVTMMGCGRTGPQRTLAHPEHLPAHPPPAPFSTQSQLGSLHLLIPQGPRSSSQSSQVGFPAQAHVVHCQLTPHTHIWWGP